MSDKARHTPGPWRADDHYCGYVWSGDNMVADSPMDEEEGAYLARMRGVGRGATRAEQRANARLIAAAPDLLEALEEMTRKFTSYDENETYKKARAAIAKANGSTAGGGK